MSPSSADGAVDVEASGGPSEDSAHRATNPAIRGCRCLWSLLLGGEKTKAEVLIPCRQMVCRSGIATVADAESPPAKKDGNRAKLSFTTIVLAERTHHMYELMIRE